MRNVYHYYTEMNVQFFKYLLIFSSIVCTLANALYHVYDISLM